MPLPSDIIYEMLRNVRFYGTGWRIDHAGQSVDIDGTLRTGKDDFFVIKRIKPTVSSKAPETND